MSFHVLIGRLELKYSSKIVTKLTDNLYKGPSPGLSNSSYSQDFLNFNPFVSGLQKRLELSPFPTPVAIFLGLSCPKMLIYVQEIWRQKQKTLSQNVILFYFLSELPWTRHTASHFSCFKTINVICHRKRLRVLSLVFSSLQSIFYSHYSTRTAQPMDRGL